MNTPTPPESPVHAVSSATITIEQLGKEIVARIEAGDKSKAGLLLIEARRRVPVKNISAFLRDNCNGLFRTHARDLIAIAEGWTTAAETPADSKRKPAR